jgi:hypothetical protein
MLTAFSPVKRKKVAQKKALQSCAKARLKQGKSKVYQVCV